MLVATLIYYYVEFFYYSHYSEKFYGYGALKQIADLIPIFLVSFSVALFMWSITLFQLDSFYIIVIQIGYWFVAISVSYKPNRP
jgi:hypothetical protein